MAAKNKYYSILVEEENFIAVDKSAGVLSIPGRGDELPDVLTSLRQNYDEVLPVHRIDKDTSGILLFARNPEMHAYLSDQFAKRSVRKAYLAITAGCPPQDSGVIEFKLEVSGQGKSRVSSRGKPSKTAYQVMERFNGYCFLELRPLTGRLHQIRVHLSSSGFPLAIDPLYGNTEPISIADIKKLRTRINDDEQVHPLLKRMPLHASGIFFTNIDGSERQIECPLPKDMRAFVNQLRKWRSTV